MDEKAVLGNNDIDDIRWLSSLTDSELVSFAFNLLLGRTLSLRICRVNCLVFTHLIRICSWA